MSVHCLKEAPGSIDKMCGGNSWWSCTCVPHSQLAGSQISLLWAGTEFLFVRVKCVAWKPNAVTTFELTNMNLYVVSVHQVLIKSFSADVVVRTDCRWCWCDGVMLQNSESTLSLDARVRDHIVHLAISGLRNLSEVQRQLQQSVDLQLFVNAPAPSATDARFRPTNSTVLNTMYRTVSKTQYFESYDFLYFIA